MDKVHLSQKKELEAFFQIKENYNLVSPDRIAEVDGLLAGETYSAIASRKSLSPERIRQRLWKEVKLVKKRLKWRLSQETTSFGGDRWWQNFGLSQRAENCLEQFATYKLDCGVKKRAKHDEIITYHEFSSTLKAHGIKFLLKLPNCGLKSAYEIIERVKVIDPYFSA